MLQVGWGFYPAQAWGGPVKVMYENGLELIRRGHKVTVCCSDRFDKGRRLSRSEKTQTIDGIRTTYLPVHTLPWWNGTIGPAFLLGGWTGLAREISRHDLIHIHGYRNALCWTAALLSFRAGVPIVLQPHGAAPAVLGHRRLKRAYDAAIGSRLLRWANAIIALQETECRQIIAAGADPQKIVVIPNGMRPVQPNRSSQGHLFRSRYGIGENERVVLFLGRINVKKGIDLLIEAFSRIAPDLDARLVIAGPDDGYLGKVKTLISNLGLEERVTITGLLLGEQVYEAYSDADVFVLPCRVDTFPMSVIESAMCGTPVIVSNQCEIAGLVDKRFGESVPFDPATLAEALRGILLSDEKRAEYAANARQIFQQEFTIASAVDRLEDVYTKVLRGTGEAFASSRSLELFVDA